MRHTCFRTAASLLALLLPACWGQVDETAPAEPAAGPERPVPPLLPTADPGYRNPDLYLPPFEQPPSTPASPRPPAVRLPSQPWFGAPDAVPGPHVMVDPRDVATEPGASAPATAISGGTLLVLREGQIAVASDPDRDRIFVADLARGVVVRELVLEPGSEPGRLAEDAAGRVFVVLRGSGQLVTLEPKTFAVAERRAVCPAPRGVAVLPDGSRVYVACAGGELVALPAAGGPPQWTRRLERDLRDVLLDADGVTLMVTTFRSARLLLTDLEGNPRDVLSPPEALNLNRRLRAGPEGPAATRFTPSVAWRALAAPGGGAVMLHQRGFTGQIPADPGRAESSGGYGGGNSCGGVVQTVVSQVGGAAPRRPAPEIPGAVMTVDAALSRDGRTLALVGLGQAHTPMIGSTIHLGPLQHTARWDDDAGCMHVGPTSFERQESPLPWSDEDRQVLQRRHLRGEAVAVAFDGRDDLVVQLREPAELVVPRRGQRIRLSDDSRANVGQAIFHADTSVGIACGSCHPEGGEDGRVWRFVDLGPRRTQSLRGGISATAPLHWDGDMRDLGQIAREVYTNRMNGPELTTYEIGALSRWIDGIPLLPTATGSDAGAVARGQALFQSAQTGCVACHNGPRLTNNLSVDVGTGRILQVPSLLGLGARAPYLHTGCAPTVAARFSPDCGGGDRHGVTSGLTSEQASDLQAYLESL
jgi:mono/diheme cytochrome c family protein